MLDPSFSSASGPDHAGALTRLALLAKTTTPAGQAAREHLYILLKPKIQQAAWVVAKRSQQPNLVVDDLRQAAALGMLLAVLDFDPAHGTRFSTWAYYHIRKSVQRAFEAGQYLAMPESLDAFLDKYDEEHIALGHDEKGFQNLEQNELSRRVALLLRLLPPRRLDLLRRVYWHEEEQSSVAAALGTNKMAISRAVRATLHHLRKTLDDYAA